mmetsp:Transcript_16546/g.35660  ORF Transcript_16546/g.35660 Transcript_16546/m.35660 type:complete len:215 (+) Transcript_16546:884-1528(+)
MHPARSASAFLLRGRLPRHHDRPLHDQRRLPPARRERRRGLRRGGLGRSRERGGRRRGERVEGVDVSIARGAPGLVRDGLRLVYVLQLQDVARRPPHLRRQHGLSRRIDHGHFGLVLPSHPIAGCYGRFLQGLEPTHRTAHHRGRQAACRGRGPRCSEAQDELGDVLHRETHEALPAAHLHHNARRLVRPKRRNSHLRPEEQGQVPGQDRAQVR